VNRYEYTEAWMFDPLFLVGLNFVPVAHIMGKIA
jgi:hypothetical protein